jgi:Ni2+-binding GTPase involved in maturation of urease and hydrogenase
MKPNIPDYSVPRRSMHDYKHPLRVGVGGPVGSGKTALLEAL